MINQIIKWGVSSFLFLILLGFSSVMVPGNTAFGAEDTGHDPQDGQDNDEGCCVCLTDTCCFVIKENQCDPEGNLKDPFFLELFFGLVGTNAAAFCDTCNQCAENEFSTEEDAQFLDICDLCILEPLFQKHMCSPIPSPIADDFIFGGGPSCLLNPYGTNGRGIGGMIIALLGGIVLLGGKKFKVCWGKEVSKKCQKGSTTQYF